jgi:hypothetical protein
MISGWKTKTGVIATAVGGGLLAGSKMAPTDEIGLWMGFAGTIIATIGASLAGYGIADKIEKAPHK